MSSPLGTSLHLPVLICLCILSLLPLYITYALLSTLCYQHPRKKSHCISVCCIVIMCLGMMVWVLVTLDVENVTWGWGSGGAADVESLSRRIPYPAAEANRSIIPGSAEAADSSHGNDGDRTQPTYPDAALDIFAVKYSYNQDEMHSLAAEHHEVAHVTLDQQYQETDSSLSSPNGEDAADSRKTSSPSSPAAATLPNYPPVYGIPFRIMYYTLFCLILFVTFLVAPFSYFFYEAGDSEIPLKTRILSAIKYTIFTVVALSILIAIALVLAFFDTSVQSDSDRQSLDIKKILEVGDYGVNAVAFLVGCMACLGIVPFLVFTGCGMGALPLSLVGRFSKHIKMHLGNIDEEKDVVQDRLGVLRTKRNLGKKLSRSEEKEFKSLMEKRSLLDNRKAKLSERASMSGGKKLLLLLSSILRIFVAIILVVVNTVVVLSLLANSVWRAFTSDFGLFGGFLPSKVFEVQVTDGFYLLLNPLDFALVMSAELFPLDWVLFSLLITLFVWATMNALRRYWRAAWKFLCITCYPIRWKRTYPQALLLRTLVFMFAMLTAFFVFFAFAPQYVTFGSQEYYDFSTEQWRFCDYTQVGSRTNGTLPPPPSNGSIVHHDPYKLRPCYMTEIATLTYNLNTRMWGIFGIIFYVVNYGFVLFFALGVLVSLVQLKPKNPTAGNDLYDEDEEDDYSTDESEYGLIQ